MTAKKPGQENKPEKHVEKLTDEEMDKVSGGTGECCFPAVADCPPCRDACDPLIPPWMREMRKK